MQHLRAKAVFFDAVGTLFHLRAPVGQIYLELARPYGLENAEPDLAERLTRAFRRALAAQKPLAFPDQPRERVPALEREWWKSVVKATFSPLTRLRNFEAFFDDVYEMFRTAEGWQLDPEADRVLTGLREKGIRIGLITNYDSRVLDVLESLGIRDLFDATTVSTLTGAAKPDPLIFQAACAALSCPPAQAAHVGDEYEDDLEGASRAGLNAILYDPAGRYRDRNLSRICKLAELLEILL